MSFDRFRSSEGSEDKGRHLDRLPLDRRQELHYATELLLQNHFIADKCRNNDYRFYTTLMRNKVPTPRDQQAFNNSIENITKECVPSLEFFDTTALGREIDCEYEHTGRKSQLFVVAGEVRGRGEHTLKLSHTVTQTLSELSQLELKSVSTVIYTTTAEGSFMKNETFYDYRPEEELPRIYERSLPPSHNEVQDLLQLIRAVYENYQPNAMTLSGGYKDESGMLTDLIPQIYNEEL